MRYLQTNKNSKKINMDAKDWKIISILSANCRIPLTILSRKVGLSRDAVNYRIINYEKNGMIQGYRTMVDITQFGYKANHLFVKLNNPNPRVEEKILKRLNKFPFIRAIIKFSGNFDYEIAFITKDIEDLDRTITKIILAFEGFIQDYEILTISKRFICEALPINNSLNLSKRINKTSDKKIDKKDIQILNLISEEANMPLYEIGSKLGVSADTASYRIKNMIDSGVIIKFIPVINYTSLDYNLYTMLFNIKGLDENKENILKKFLLSEKNSIFAVKSIGRYNVLIYMLVKNIDELQESILKLRSLFPREMNHYETLIAYEEYKYTYFPKNLFKE